MAYVDNTAMEGLLKRLYPFNRIMDLSARKNPFFNMVKKNSNGGGEAISVPLQVTGASNFTPTFSVAQGNPSIPQVKKFLFTGVTNFGLVEVQGDTLRSAKGDAQAIMNVVKLAGDRQLSGFTNRLGTLCMATGNGELGTMTAISSGVITLASKAEVSRFPIGTVLQAADANFANPPAALGYVISSDVGASTITISDTAGGSAATPTGWSTSYPKLCQYGARGGEFKGVGAWVPSTAPTGGDSFGGLDRSLYGSVASGIRFSGSGLPMKSALIQCAELAVNEGASPEYAFVNPTDYASLVDSLGTYVRYNTVKPFDATVSFEGVVVATSDGSVTVLADRSVNKGTCYLLDMNTWELFSAGQIISPADAIGGQFWRMRDGYDLFEGRWCSPLAQLTCTAPGWNSVITSFGA